MGENINHKQKKASETGFLNVRDFGPWSRYKSRSFENRDTLKKISNIHIIEIETTFDTFVQI